MFNSFCIFGGLQLPIYTNMKRYSEIWSLYSCSIFLNRQPIAIYHLGRYEWPKYPSLAMDFLWFKSLYVQQIIINSGKSASRIANVHVNSLSTYSYPLKSVNPHIERRANFYLLPMLWLPIEFPSDGMVVPTTPLYTLFSITHVKSNWIRSLK